MTDVLRETNFGFLGKKKAGKVRDIYEQKDRIILVTTDRHSSFDRIIAHVPHKGQVLNQITEFWMDATKDIVPNHIIAVPDPNVTVAKKCRTVPVEAVVRGYITGVTDTSLWTHYSKGKRDFGNFKLPDGMKKNQQLLRPVFTPSTKADDHDRTLSPQEMVEEGIVSRKMIDEVERIAIALFRRGQDVAASKGLILVDTKYEFGQDETGALVLIDEIHTPDSSRYWFKDDYDALFGEAKTSSNAGSSPDTSQGEVSREPKSFDKEFLRLWFKEHSDPYNDAVLPEAPPELVEELSRRYIRMYEQLTGQSFQAGKEPIIPRIEKNLRSFTA